MDANSLRAAFEKGFVSSDQLFWSAKLLSQSYKSSPAFLDNRYLPFYYHLGKFTLPERVIQVGKDSGLAAVAFLKGCGTVKEWAFVSHDPLGGLNVRQLGVGLCGVNGLFDMAILPEPADGETFTSRLEEVWRHLRPEGLLVADYIHVDANRERFAEFCRVKNREPVTFDTRYGVGIIQR